LPDFSWRVTQNGEVQKWPKNANKVYLYGDKNTKWPLNTPKYFIPRPSKIYQNKLFYNHFGMLFPFWYVPP
jgi:hypothetical protein